MTEVEIMQNSGDYKNFTQLKIYGDPDEETLGYVNSNIRNFIQLSMHEIVEIRPPLSKTDVIGNSVFYVTTFFIKDNKIEPDLDNENPAVLYFSKESPLKLDEWKNQNGVESLAIIGVEGFIYEEPAILCYQITRITVH